MLRDLTRRVARLCTRFGTLKSFKATQFCDDDVQRAHTAQDFLRGPCCVLRDRVRILIQVNVRSHSIVYKTITPLQHTNTGTRTQAHILIHIYSVTQNARKARGIYDTLVASVVRTLTLTQAMLCVPRVQ